MMYTEEMKIEDLKALQEVVSALNDLICLISKSGKVPTVVVEQDEQWRPQVIVRMED